MKTLIINGSPHLDGNTYTLIDIVIKGLSDEYRIIDAYKSNIAPCIDCGGCKKSIGCVKKDDMRVVYECIENCDNIIIASPIYFGELTPPVLNIGSRLQAYYNAAEHLNVQQSSNHKKGGIILTGGGSSGKSDCAVITAKILLRQMGAKDIFDPIYSLHTDKTPASEDKAAMEKISKLTNFINNT